MFKSFSDTILVVGLVLICVFGLL